jgi:hypothetical protein
MILSRSNGETTVREAAPAMPPATKYDDTCGLNHGSAGGLGAWADEGPAAGGVRWTADTDFSDVMAVCKVGVGSWTIEDDLMRCGRKGEKAMYGCRRAWGF